MTAEERSGVKTMVYGLVYGLGIDRLAGAPYLPYLRAISLA